MRDSEVMNPSERSNLLDKLFDVGFYFCLSFWLAFFLGSAVMIITERLFNGLPH